MGYADYAVDGALLYASYLKKEYNVTALALSGETAKESKLSTFLWLKNGYLYKHIKGGFLLKPSEISHVIQQQSQPFDEEKLIKKAIEYNSLLHSYSIPEVERCTLISAVLIALQDQPFLNSFNYVTSDENKGLIASLLLACKNVLKKNDLKGKAEVILSEYAKFQNNTDFNTETIYNKKTKTNQPNTILKDFISSISQDILPYIKESPFDVLGKFYTQFIRYAGSDKKTGLVLTPSHITDFFCDIAQLDSKDIVFDPCCGTAGFLVSAMNYMVEKAANDSDKQKAIKENQLIGIEKRADMFSHACSNMMMRGDGKSQIFYGDCFDETLKMEIKRLQPTKSFLNPPYQDGNAAQQLEFVENALEYLQKGNLCMAICQMSTVVSSNNNVLLVKERLLKKHTLKAVFSMPNDLFHPIGVNTCILVFEADKPHLSNQKTFFGYFKEDGFVKQKNKGRVDAHGKWEKIKEKWLNAYVNSERIPGLSVTEAVKASDEWCAEAYMETDYSTITPEDFIKTVKEYVAFRVKYDELN